MDESIFRDCIQFSSDYEDVYTGQLLCLEIFTSITCISRWRNGIRQKNNSLGTISDIINENTWGDYKWKHLRGSIVLIKLWRARPNLGWREKINLGFYFHASSWCFRRFYEGLHKTFLRHHKDSLFWFSSSQSSLWSSEVQLSSKPVSWLVFPWSLLLGNHSSSSPSLDHIYKWKSSSVAGIA